MPTRPARRLPWGCLALAVLGLLAAGGFGLLGYNALQHAVAHRPARPRLRTLTVGPVTVMSGLTGADPCTSFGVNVDNWRCTNTYFSQGPDEPAAYRLWLFTVNQRAGVRAYRLLDIPLERPAPRRPAGRTP